MIFINEPFPGQQVNSTVSLQYIKEFLSGPDTECWNAVLLYSRHEKQQENMEEMTRVVSIAAHAHARYHFNLPTDCIEDMLVSSTIEIINRMDELLGYHPVRMFAEIEMILVHHEPFVNCYEPKGDAEEMKETMARYNPDS